MYIKRKTILPRSDYIKSLKQACIIVLKLLTLMHVPTSEFFIYFLCWD